ncbi:hypothetical protein NST99_14885 [Paenibacillus sp. FSL L8-0470]|uniref:hypothetical protein n=1 Tax=Paenibacillus sp. FSL L8-0470 TaxID=2954688 RepID=UPI0030F9372A
MLHEITADLSYSRKIWKQVDDGSEQQVNSGMRRKLGLPFPGQQIMIADKPSTVLNFLRNANRMEAIHLRSLGRPPQH